MSRFSSRPKIGVMGSARGALDDADFSRLEPLAIRLGKAISEHGCVLVTGATTGLTEMVSRSARASGGLTVGISPGANLVEHAERYGLPVDSTDVIIYTGFGLKGRNVVNIRSSDVVIIFSGGMGTLNEFTIAYDEGKIIGVLEETGGIADKIRDLISVSKKKSFSTVLFDKSPEELLKRCLQALRQQPEPPPVV